MALSLVTAPAVEPVSLDEAKRHLRVEVSDEDALIRSLIVAAREYIEVACHRRLVSQTWDLKLDAFPCDVIVLPFPPVSAVSSISYVDGNGDTQTWSSALYRTDLPSGPYASPARITPVYGESYPGTRSVTNAVTVRFVCGYGASPESVPDSVRAAVKLKTESLHLRSSDPKRNEAIQLAIESLVWPFKSF